MLNIDMAVYKGYSTINRDFGPVSISDNDLIVQDFLNHLSIRKGEKLHNPNFGTIIWNRLFDPLTPALKLEIKNDIDNLIAYDPRFNIVSQTVVQESPDGRGLLLNFSLSFATDNKIADLQVLFDKSSNKLYVV
jgi:phage baseplate assembly protein W